MEVQFGAHCIEGLGRMLLDHLCVGQQSCGLLDTQTGLVGLHAVAVETLRCKDPIDMVPEYFSQVSFFYVVPGMFEILPCGDHQLISE